MVTQTPQCVFVQRSKRMYILSASHTAALLDAGRIRSGFTPVTGLACAGWKSQIGPEFAGRLGQRGEP